MWKSSYILLGFPKLHVENLHRCQELEDKINFNKSVATLWIIENIRNGFPIFRNWSHYFINIETITKFEITVIEIAET